MVSCYDCEHFGIKCAGIVPPIEFRDRIDEYCSLFTMVSWRDEMYKPAGTARMS
jgi:hypothetical protein